MPTFPPSVVMWNIQSHPGLRQRVEAIVRDHWWNDTTDPRPDPTKPVPVDHLAWAAATNNTIRQHVTSNIAEGNIVAAVDTINESDLEYVVVNALLRAGGEPA